MAKDDSLRARLVEFRDWVAQHITGDEKGQAQIFLDRLFQALGHKGCLDVGGTPEYRIRKDRQAGGGTAFADYVWKPHVLIEMKKRGENLHKHYRQAFDYWVRAVPGRPRYVMLCNFDEFWIYDFETQMDTPVDQLPLAELPERWGPLAFLLPSHDVPVFGNDHEKVTRDAADKLATCFNKLLVRHVERETAQRFTLQMLVALFSEDIDLLPRYFVARLLDECESPADSYDLLGTLFTEMNTPGKTPGGRFKDVDYFNGGLFAEPARIELYEDELNQLRQAAKFDWSKVRPEIFGTLFEHSLDHGERHAYGAHFTTAVDIMKIVGPTIVEPWRAAIERAARGSKPVEKLEQLHHRMQNYRVLDPACGSGNFLYLAYRELKRLEMALFERLNEASKSKDKTTRMSFVTARQFYGMDINPFAVEIAKVTMMIARKLAIDELGITEHPLPLDNLDGNFQACDALITPLNEGGDKLPTMLFAELEEDPFASGNVIPTAWPPADVIIGNPPFLGSRYLPKERGYSYVRAVRRAYPNVPKMADYCVYWFRKAHEHLPECTAKDPVAGRAGLVGTQNIRNNKSREGGLDHVSASGTIVEAVDNQPWSGEANVHVSIVNWVKTQAAKLLPKRRRLWFKTAAPKGREKIRRRGSVPAHKDYELSFRNCDEINAALSDGIAVDTAQRLKPYYQPKQVYVGQYPFNKGFMLEFEEAHKLIRQDSRLRDVVFPYMIGRDLLDDGTTPSRWIIDFGQRDMLEASSYPLAFQIVKQFVMPDVLAHARQEQEVTGKKSTRWSRLAQRWWQFRDYQPGTMSAISKVDRYIACSRVTKRPVFAFISKDIHPDNTLMVFAFEDDYSFGVLQSNAHWQWFVAKCSKLTERFRYTPESVFDTFPWPQSPTVKDVKIVAAAGREVRRIRDDALTKMKGGLRAVYRTLELPGKNPLKDAHAELDRAVLAAYGFDGRGDLLGQLLALNLEVAEGIEAGREVTPPGVPPNYPRAAGLVTGDCIRAPGL